MPRGPKAEVIAPRPTPPADHQRYAHGTAVLFHRVTRLGLTFVYEPCKAPIVLSPK